MILVERRSRDTGLGPGPERGVRESRQLTRTSLSVTRSIGLSLFLCLSLCVSLSLCLCVPVSGWQAQTHTQTHTHTHTHSFRHTNARCTGLGERLCSTEERARQAFIDYPGSSHLNPSQPCPLSRAHQSHGGSGGLGRASGEESTYGSSALIGRCL